MKKLVTAACALVAASAFAVESANTVGYQETTCIAGLNFIAPNFEAIGTDSVTLGDLALSGANVTSAGDNLQILDEEGGCVASYTWSLNGDFGANDGWYDDNMAYAATDVISRGMSMLLACDEDGVVITVKGQVDTTSIELTAVAGLNSVGNFFPAPIPVGNIVLSGANVTSAGDNLQILDEEGGCVASYTWSLNGDFGANDGWYDDNMAYAASDSIPAGLGMLLACDEDGVEVAINYTMPASNNN